MDVISGTERCVVGAAGIGYFDGGTIKRCCGRGLAYLNGSQTCRFTARQTVEVSVDIVAADCVISCGREGEPIQGLLVRFDSRFVTEPGKRRPRRQHCASSGNYCVGP